MKVWHINANWPQKDTKPPEKTQNNCNKIRRDGKWPQKMQKQAGRIAKQPQNDNRAT